MVIVNCLYLVVIISLLNSFNAIKTNTDRCLSEWDKIVYIILSIPMLYIRFAVDISSVPDLYRYGLVYSELSNIPIYQIFSSEISVRIEYGYRLLMKICTYISDDFHFFLFFSGTITHILIFKTFRKYSNYFFVSIVIYYLMLFTTSIYVLRQYLAMLFVFLSFDAILEKKLKKYIILWFVAFSLHNATLVTLPMFFICNVNVNKKYILVLISLFIVLVLMFRPIFIYFGSNVFSGYGNYLNTDKYMGTNYTDSLIIFCFLLAYIFFVKKQILINKLDKLLFSFLFVSFSISVAGVGFPLVGRLSLFLYSVIIFIVPRIMYYIRSSIIRFLFLLLTTTLIALAFFQDVSMDTYQISQNFRFYL